MDWLTILKRLKAQSGMTTKEIAAESGVPEPTLEKIFAGATKNPSVTAVQRIVHAIGYTLDDLDPRPINKNSAPVYSTEALSIIVKYEAASPDIKAAVRAVLSVVNVPATTDAPRKQTKKVYLFGQSFAAGTSEYPGDRFMEQYETDDLRADFAIHVNGDSMEPYLHDGSIALGVNRLPKDGEVGAFFLDGGFLVKQCCVDSYSNVYLFSLNRKRRDADERIWASSGRDLRVIGTILMDKRIPLPED